MKKQRKNTVSRDAVAKEMPREERKERKESRDKKPWEFEKKERPSRKPRRDKREDSYPSSDRKVTRAPRERDENGKPKRRNTRSRSEETDQRPERRECEERNNRRDQNTGRNRSDRTDRRGDNRDRKKPARQSSDQDYFSNFDDKNRKKRKEDFKVRRDKNTFDDNRTEGKKPRKFEESKEERRERKPKWSKEQKLQRAIKEGRVAPPEEEKEMVPEKMPLNKYISRAGVCSRREAADLIKAGEVKVNGTVHKEPGYKVVEGDVISYQGNDLEKQEKMVYLLLNKAKDYITTTDDPEGRKTVMDLFTGVEERIFPVGRLDRNTTGLLLLTNDGNLAQKLSHPKFNNKKVYQVKLDKELQEEHFVEIQKGLELEDGIAQVDSLALTNPEDRKEIGIEIHIGKNRIVRRIFEHLGYEVKHLDRVMYAGLTKKNLPRGKWRALTDKELVFLKHFK
jgi:23S rRNA pseudouridine2605 synthase